MGVVVYAAYFVCHKVSHSNAVSTVIAVLVGMIVYAACLAADQRIDGRRTAQFPERRIIDPHCKEIPFVMILDKLETGRKK